MALVTSNPPTQKTRTKNGKIFTNEKGKPGKKGGAQRPLYLQQEVEALSKPINRGCFSAAAAAAKQKESEGKSAAGVAHSTPETHQFRFTQQEFPSEARARQMREQDEYHSSMLD